MTEPANSDETPAPVVAVGVATGATSAPKLNVEALEKSCDHLKRLQKEPSPQGNTDEIKAQMIIYLIDNIGYILSAISAIQEHETKGRSPKNKSQKRSRVNNTKSYAGAKAELIDPETTDTVSRIFTALLRNLKQAGDQNEINIADAAQAAFNDFLKSHKACLEAQSAGRVNPGSL